MGGMKEHTLAQGLAAGCQECVGYNDGCAGGNPAHTAQYWEGRLVMAMAAMLAEGGHRFLNHLGPEAIERARAEGHTGIMETDKMYHERLARAGLEALKGGGK